MHTGRREGKLSPLCCWCVQEEGEGAAAGGGSAADAGRKYADYSYEQLLQRVTDIITSKVWCGRGGCGVGRAWLVVGECVSNQRDEYKSSSSRLFF
jgi:hypothetical protein